MQPGPPPRDRRGLPSLQTDKNLRSRPFALCLPHSQQNASRSFCCTHPTPAKPCNTRSTVRTISKAATLFHSSPHSFSEKFSHQPLPNQPLPHSFAKHPGWGPFGTSPSCQSHSGHVRPTHLHPVSPAESYGYFTVRCTPPGIPPLPRASRSRQRVALQIQAVQSRSMHALSLLCGEVFPSTPAQSTTSALFCKTPGVGFGTDACTLPLALLQSRFQQAQPNQQLTPFFARTTGGGV